MTAAALARLSEPQPHNLTPFSSDAAKAAASARIVNIENMKAWAELNLRKNFADQQHWNRLARTHGIRMPAWFIPGAATLTVVRCLRKAGITPQAAEEALGCSLKEYAKENPDWPAFALVGTILEDFSNNTPEECLEEQEETRVQRGDSAL
ncbi:hypothetical protein P3W53_25480 [Pseudomonas denitrificans (nom. rej.)]|nr:hypothetical protein [Pseudomonas denitrificans (nom. rej.)]